MDLTDSPGFGLRHLRAFVAACEEGTVGRAAARLNLTQPAVSKILSELEAVVGHRLLDRGRAGTRATARGEAFLAEARKALEAMRAARALLEDDAPAQAVVRLGVLPTVAPALVPPAAARFRDLHPGVGLVIVTRANAELLSLLRLGDLDLVIGRMADPSATAGLTFELLYLEGLSIGMRRGHPLADVSPPSLRQVLDYPLIVCASGSVPHRNTETILGLSGLRLPANCIETLDVALAARLVETTDAIWLAPTGAVRAVGDLHSHEIGRTAQAGAEGVGLFRRIDSPQRLQTEALVGCIREVGTPRENG
jgi:DNA-binding transcriptional LysR family regulator